MTERLCDAVEYMNMIMQFKPQEGVPEYDTRWGRRIAWACDIVVERDKEIEQLKEKIDLAQIDEITRIAQQQEQEWMQTMVENESLRAKIAKAHAVVTRALTEHGNDTATLVEIATILEDE